MKKPFNINIFIGGVLVGFSAPPVLGFLDPGFNTVPLLIVGIVLIIINFNKPHSSH